MFSTKRASVILEMRNAAFLKKQALQSRAQWHRMFETQTLIGTIVVGLFMGAIAKFLMPGRDPGGCIILLLLGIAGSFVGAFFGRVLFGPGYVAGWIASLVGTM